MSELIAELCYLGQRDGILIPVARTADAIASPAQVSVTIHAFSSGEEARAFAAGIKLAGGNGWSPGLGEGRLAHLVALTRHDEPAEAEIAVIDHGGAAHTRFINRWSWLMRRVTVHTRRYPRGPNATFVAGDPPALKIEHRPYTLALDADHLVMSCPSPASATRLTEALAAVPPSALALTVEDARVTLRVPRDSLASDIRAFAAMLSEIDRIGRVLWQCQHQEARETALQAIRQDRRYCRVVEKMLAGWSLVNNQGRGEIRPPSGSASRTQTLGYAMLDNLLASGLIHDPAKRDRGQRSWGAIYAVGDLTGSGVKTSAANPRGGSHVG